jgi:hypothetical protein
VFRPESVPEPTPKQQPEPTPKPEPTPEPEQKPTYSRTAEILALRAAFEKIGIDGILKEIKRIKPSSRLNRKDIIGLRDTLFKNRILASGDDKICDTVLRHRMADHPASRFISYDDASILLAILREK